VIVAIICPNWLPNFFRVLAALHFFLQIASDQGFQGTLAPHNMANNISLEPKQLFVTSSGRIGVIIEMGEELSLRMTALQRNMASVDEGAGGTSHTRRVGLLWVVVTLQQPWRFRFRAPKNQKGISDAETLSSGFLDGDFLEQFLAHLSSPVLDKVLQGQSEAEQLSMTPSEIREVLEALQSLHWFTCILDLLNKSRRSDGFYLLSSENTDCQNFTLCFPSPKKSCFPTSKYNSFYSLFDLFQPYSTIGWLGNFILLKLHKIDIMKD
jgi:hypothetical protein